MLTKEQIQQLGYSFYEAPEVKTELGYVTNPQQFYGAGSSGVLQQLDSSTAEYLRSLGLLETTDRSATGALSRYNTVGGNTITSQYLEGQYGQIATKQAAAQEEQRVQLGNQAIASGNVADVEKYFPGYTLWNGAFVDKTKIPELQAQGATVDAQGNVVGAPLKTPTSLTSLPGQEPSVAYTPPQTTNANNTVYKDAQGNVFKADGTPIDQATFQKMGLNIDHINTKAQLASRTAGQQEADNTYTAGATTTGRTPAEQTDFFKNLEARLNRADAFESQILASMEKSAEERKLEKEIGDISSSFEAGLTDIQGQTIPMQLITGQGAQLEKQANNKLRALGRTLELLQNNREEKFNVLSKAYDMSRQSVNDAITLYKLTAPEKLAFDSETGTVYMQNPMTGEVYQSKVAGFQGSDKFVSDLMTKYPDAGILKTDTYSQAAQKLQNSKIYQQQTRLADGTSEKETKEEKVIADFGKAVSGWDWTANANREQFIRQLRGQFPQIDPNDIARKVYEIYPDNFNQLK